MPHGPRVASQRKGLRYPAAILMYNYEREAMVLGLNYCGSTSFKNRVIINERSIATWGGQSASRKSVCPPKDETQQWKS